MRASSLAPIYDEAPRPYPLQRRRLARWSKRAFDLTVAGIGLVILLPLILAVMLWLRLTSPGPIFYTAQRVGLRGKPFRLFKFRTMYVDADRIGPGVTRENDPRITPVGRLLRRTKLDELPQLFNVLKGDMSLVGPRPEDPRYVAHYTDEQRRVLTVRPGITSLASIRYRNEEQLLVGANWEQVYIQQIMPDKLFVDLRYLEHWSFSLDLRILFYTFFVLPSLDDTDLL